MQYQSLIDSRNAQRSKWAEADSQFNLYLIAHDLSLISGAKEAKEDAAVLLADSLVSYHLAANDISPLDGARAQFENAAKDIDVLEEKLAAGNMPSAKASPQPAAPQAPTSSYGELGEQIRGVENLANAELESREREAFWLVLLPKIKSYREKWIQNFSNKEREVKALQERRATLARRQTLIGYLAIGLQVFGLMLILAKDLSKDQQQTEKPSIAATDEEA